MSNIEKNLHCPNCGAPVTSEICPYCHVSTGLNTWSADMEYPVIECKEANIGFWSVGFPFIFVVAFGFASIGTHTLIKGVSVFDVFTIIAIVAFIIGIRPIINYFILKNNGKEIDGTVYGYINDNVMINGAPAQVVKILVNTNEGPRFIMYQLASITQPYKINSKIKLKVYKNVFMILNDKKYYF